MPDATSGWAGLAARSPVASFIDINLRGAGQVIFQDNPLSGLLFTIAVLWGAVMAGAVEIAIGAVIALVIATVTAMVLDADAASLKQGLFGFNGILVGAAVPTFLADGPSMWVLLVIGAAVSTVIMLAFSTVMKTWAAPVLTFPFVLTAWFLTLAAYSFDTVTIVGMEPPMLARAAAGTATGFDLSSLLVIEAWLKGPAQVFLINNWISGVLVVIGLAVSSLRAAGFALAGSAIGVFLSMALGVGSKDVSVGLYGYSAVLTAVALGCVFYKPSFRVALYALLATVFTVIVQAAMDAAFAPIGIPTLTAPFVLVTWLFLLPKANLKPHPHGPIENGIITKVKND